MNNTASKRGRKASLPPKTTAQDLVAKVTEDVFGSQLVKDLLVQALDKVGPSDDRKREASKRLESGLYGLDATIRIRGTLTKGKDYDTTVTGKVEVWRLLHLVFSRLDEDQVKAALDDYRYNRWEPKDPAEIETTKAKIEGILDGLAAKHRITAAGRVTGALTTEIVQVGEAAERKSAL